MLDYTVLDAAELIDHFDIPTDDIEECTGVWGDGVELVLCLTLVDEYLWLEQREVSMYIERQENESFDKYLPDYFDDYVLDPDDINDWLEQSGRLDEAHEY